MKKQKYTLQLKYILEYISSIHTGPHYYLAIKEFNLIITTNSYLLFKKKDFSHSVLYLNVNIDCKMLFKGSKYYFSMEPKS